MFTECLRLGVDIEGEESTIVALSWKLMIEGFGEGVGFGVGILRAIGNEEVWGVRGEIGRIEICTEAVRPDVER